MTPTFESATSEAHPTSDASYACHQRGSDSLLHVKTNKQLSSVALVGIASKTLQEKAFCMAGQRDAFSYWVQVPFSVLFRCSNPSGTVFGMIFASVSTHSPNGYTKTGTLK